LERAPQGWEGWRSRTAASTERLGLWTAGRLGTHSTKCCKASATSAEATQHADAQIGLVGSCLRALGGKLDIDYPRQCFNIEVFVNAKVRTNVNGARAWQTPANEVHQFLPVIMISERLARL
jgi:hypothetical protein